MRLSLPCAIDKTIEVRIEPNGSVVAWRAGGNNWRSDEHTVFGAFCIRTAGVDRVNIQPEHWPIIMAARDAVLKGEAPCD